jgi:hypothetical protein
MKSAAKRSIAVRCTTYTKAASQETQDPAVFIDPDKRPDPFLPAEACLRCLTDTLADLS